MKNWKTTLFGGLAAVCTALTTVLPEYKEVLIGAASIFGAICAFFMKDSNVTGGTITQ